MAHESVVRANAAFESLQGASTVIPEGPYCYAIVAIENRDGNSPVIKTKSCPYLASTGDYGNYCAFTKITDDLLLWDSCKVCGVNDNDPFE
jgi:hypothetical protein